VFVSASAKPVGGGGARHPNSLANLQPGAGAGDGGLQRAATHRGFAQIAHDQLDAKTLSIMDALSADAPLRSTDGALPVHDSAAVALLADCLCRLEMLRTDIATHGVLVERGKRKGQVRPAVDLEAKLRREATSMLNELGMTPKARAALGVDVKRAESIADELEAAREAREAREARDRDAAVIDASAVDDIEEAV
jgi:hypothetical protein